MEEKASRLLPTNQLLILNVLGNAGGYMKRNGILTTLMKFDRIALSAGSLTQALAAMPERGLVHKVLEPGETSPHYAITEHGADLLRAHRAMLGRLDIAKHLVA